VNIYLVVGDNDSSSVLQCGLDALHFLTGPYVHSFRQNVRM